MSSNFTIQAYPRKIKRQSRKQCKTYCIYNPDNMSIWKGYLCPAGLFLLRWQNQRDHLGAWRAPGEGFRQRKPAWLCPPDAPVWRRAHLQRSGPCEDPAGGCRGCSSRKSPLKPTASEMKLFLHIIFSLTPTWVPSRKVSAPLPVLWSAPSVSLNSAQRRPCAVVPVAAPSGKKGHYQKYSSQL